MSLWQQLDLCLSSFLFKIQKHIKISSNFLLEAMRERGSKLGGYTSYDHFIAKPITTPQITDESFEVSPSLLNLITREEFGVSASEDAFMHLHDFL
jgi:hypothetical protein